MSYLCIQMKPFGLKEFERVGLKTAESSGTYSGKCLVCQPIK